jgi:phosphatidylglycerophosphate synthase
VRFGTYLNPANAITASRYLALPPFLCYIDRGMTQHAMVALILCGLGDLLDGPVARLFKCSSGFGELFDAVTDALCYGFCMVVLCVYGLLPWLPVVLVIALAVVNGWMRAAYARRMGRATNYKSWAMERMVAWVAYCIGIGIAQFEVDYFAWVTVPVMLLIVVHDFKRMLLDPLPQSEAA